MKYDDIIAEIGEFGPYQKKLYFVVCLAGIPAALQTLVGVFTLAIPDHRCVLPGLLNDTYKSQGQWHDDLVNRSIPWDDEEEDYSECDLYEGAGTSSIHSNKTFTCSKWVYDRDTFDSTFITQADLVCDDVSLRTYANMILMGGLLGGSLILGMLSDVIGRKKVLLMGFAGQFAVGLATAFVSTYIPFVILRFFTTFFGIGGFLSAFVIGMELVGPSYRKISGIVIEFFWVVGLFLETGLAYAFRDWRHLQIAVSVPIALVVPIFFYYLPESPRWLISRGRYEDAAKILKRTAEGNGVTLSDKMLKLEDLEQEGQGEKIWHMFTTPLLLIRCLVIFFNWLVASMVYYGLSLNVGNLSGNIYLNFFLSAVVELASYIFCLILLDATGRKPLQCFSMIIGGVACICTMFPVIYGDSDVKWVTLTLSFIGKFGASASFAIIYVFSAELFPTIMRNSGMGLSSFSARIGGILSPYVADIGNVIDGDFGIALPLLIFGGVSIAAGLLALLLPETANKKLPDTVDDAKNFGRGSSGKNSYALNDVTESSKVSGGKINPSFTMDNQI